MQIGRPVHDWLSRIWLGVSGHDWMSETWMDVPGHDWVSCTWLGVWGMTGKMRCRWMSTPGFLIIQCDSYQMRGTIRCTLHTGRCTVISVPETGRKFKWILDIFTQDNSGPGVSRLTWAGVVIVCIGTMAPSLINGVGINWIRFNCFVVTSN